MTTYSIEMAPLYNIVINGYSTQVCSKCLANMKTPPIIADLITRPNYAEECVLCKALPPMDFVKCLACGVQVHPYDEYHAEGYCDYE
jgi:ribosomal protein L40E